MDKWKRAWIDKCHDMRGKGDSSLGSCKNFVFLGLLNAYILDTKQGADNRDALRNLATSKCGDEEGKIVPMKAKNLHEVVRHAQITVIQKPGKAYLNLLVNVESHAQVAEILRRFLDAEGSRQYDPPPLQNRTRNLCNLLS